MARFFKEALRRRPLLTNTCVYGTFYSAAELTQQTFNKMYTAEHPDIDLAATARIAGVGCTVYAPTLFFWYRFLDRVFVGTALKTVIKKVASDQFIMTPILLATFYTLIGILEGDEDMFEELREKYWKSFLANQMFWIPAQTINFSYVPPQMRVVFVASVSFIWINVLCFIKRQKIHHAHGIDHDLGTGYDHDSSHDHDKDHDVNPDKNHDNDDQVKGSS